jgi:hypothetical protein
MFMESTFARGTWPKNQRKPVRVLPRNIRLGREPARADWIEDVLGGLIVLAAGLALALS